MTAPLIAIVDYRAGNVRSVERALQRFGADARITSDSDLIARADGVVFPGQGACDSSMAELRRRRLVGPIVDYIAGGRPFLGVCLGLQLLLERSEEGDEPCLGVIPGTVRRFPQELGLKVPHMGWNRVMLKQSPAMLQGVPDGSYFYFVHGYYADPGSEVVVAAKTSYGLEFCSGVAWENVLGVQFHPEKSGEIGLRVYRNFVSIAAGGEVGAEG